MRTNTIMMPGKKFTVCMKNMSMDVYIEYQVCQYIIEYICVREYSVTGVQKLCEGVFMFVSTLTIVYKCINKINGLLTQDMKRT